MSEVVELTGAEKGIWRITTHGSVYVLDLTVGTVTRHPGPQATATINDDITRRLRTLDRCRVGESGFWTMRGGGGYLSSVDFYWQSTSVILMIERLTDAPTNNS